MSITIKGHGVTLTNSPNAVAFTPTVDVSSSTIATGTAENTTGVVGVKLNVRIVGPTRSSWIIKNKELSLMNSPLVLPPMTVMRGEVLQAWSDTDNAIDLALTIGEQR